MRSFLRPAAGLTCLFALAASGCSAGGDGTSDAVPGKTPGTSAAPAPGTSAEASAGTAYAPYVSATEASATDATGSPATYNLAFVIADGSACTPSWNGTDAIGDATVTSRIAALKASGARVRVSFGGASGRDLAETCADASALAGAYGAALDAAGSSQADFDVEGTALTDSASVALRSEAIALLQKRRTGLKVSFTLPVMPSGLDAGGLALLESANDHAVTVSTVDIMTMNYGSAYTGDMGDYAETSARAAHGQLERVFGLSDAAAWRGLALTSMIGDNDVARETFGLADAAQVRAFAEGKDIAWVSMWSTARDRRCSGDAASSHEAATDCSGVEQSAGAFAKAFAG